jgi:aminocarboxymuconate-semialdehyde decarboxylase
MVTDFHSHVYPQTYVEAVRTGPSAYRVSTDEAGNPVLHSPGDYNVLVPGHRLAEARLEDMDRAGVDLHVISFPAPGTLIETPEISVSRCRLINDCLAEMQGEYPERFAALATLPLNAPEACGVELERSLGELGLKGVMVLSNVNGAALYDERFWPLYEAADEAGAVFYIHPNFPVGVEAMTDYMLMPLVGFLADTTLAAAGLVFSGVVERFPNIRWVLGHLGGAVPFLAERFDRGYEAFPRCRENISKPPSEYLKNFYYDTVNFDPKALQFTIDFAGVDKLVAGSDYPHMIGSMDKMVASIGQLTISAEDREAILSGNTVRLLRL